MAALFTYQRIGRQAFFAPAVPEGVVIPPPDTPSPVTGARFSRPIADISAGPWRPSVPGATLFDMVDDKTTGGSDFIHTTSAGEAELQLQPVEDPNANTGHVLRYEAHAPTGGSLTVQLKQGDVLIAQWLHEKLPKEPTLHEQVLTEEQCDAILDYKNLRVKLVAA